MPGALFSGLLCWVLQELSSFIISNRLHHAQATYGHFATVINILWWFYLQSVITVLGAQLNVVLHERLYPRSLSGENLTDADRQAWRPTPSPAPTTRRRRSTQECPRGGADATGD